MKKRWKKLLSVTLSACMAMPFISAVPAVAGSKKTIRVWYWEDNDGSYEEGYSNWSEQ